MLSGVHLLAVEIIKIYDDKGHTVLKKKILEHLNVGKGDLLVAELKLSLIHISEPTRPY